MDLSKLSNSDLIALQNKDYSSLSEEGLKTISGGDKPKEKSTVQNVVSALDYLGGMTRTGAAALVGQAGQEEWERAKRGEAPSTSEYLEKAGASKWGSLSDVLPSLYSETGDEWTKLKKGGALDITGRGAAGFVGDVALDPLTYLSGGATALAKSGAVKAAPKAVQYAAKTADIALNPIQKALEKGGKSLYKGGFKKIDTRLAEKNIEPLSEYMYKQNVVGGLETVLNRMEARQKELMAQRAPIYEAIEKAGGTVDPYEAARPAMETLIQKARLPYAKGEVEKGLEFLAQADKPLPISVASEQKTALYDMLPATAFDPSGRLTSSGKELLQDLSSGYKKAIEETAEKTIPGSGKNISDINKEYGVYASAMKPTRSEISKEGRKDILSQVKGAMAVINPKAMAAMYGAQAVNSPYFRSTVGLATGKGAAKIPSGVWNRMLIDSMGER